jgi:superfamily II DNA or RNA helicase
VLRPHQVAPAQELLDILRVRDAAVDWSDCGVGKTYMAAWVAAQLRIPTLVVCPHISQSSWHRAAAAFGDTLSVINYESLRTGKHPYGSWDRMPGPREEYFQCVNCQCKFKPGQSWPACYTRHDGVHCFETRKKSQKLGRFTFNPAVRFVIFDEAHRASGISSLNADMLIGAKRGGQKILGLSATPATSPLHLRALGFVLGLHQLTNFDSWLSRLGVRRIPGGGYKWMVSKARQLEIMAAIRAQIIPERGIRVTIDSIPDFPECDISAELYDLEKSGRIEECYAEMAEALTDLKTFSADDKAPDHPLTKLLRAQQEIELLKIPIVEELTADYLAKGFSVAVFVNYSQTISELAKRLETDAIIDGSPNGVRFRDRSIARFQDNSARVILANVRAGGCSISLPDDDGDHPRVGLVFPGTSATDLRQVFGRLRRHGGKSRSYYRVILANTPSERSTHRALTLKLDNLDALNDSDLSPENLRLGG